MKSKDENGYTVLHLVAEYNLRTVAEEILSHPDVDDILHSLTRNLRQTALHRAAYCDADDVLNLLIAKGCRSNDNSNYLGQTPLHIAAIAGAQKVWLSLVSIHAVDSTVCDKWGRTAIELLQLSGWEIDRKNPAVIFPNAFNVLGKSSTVPNSTSSESLKKTAIVGNMACADHHTCPPSQLETSAAPPENIKRLEVLIDLQKGSLRSSELATRLQFILRSKEATISDVLRVHEWSYVKMIHHKSNLIISDDPEDVESGMGSLDGDTSISRGSFKAAMAAAGAVCHAVDMVARQEFKNSFCPIRPPGTVSLHFQKFDFTHIQSYLFC